MTKLPKVFIGTLHSGEGDFAEMLRAVHHQVGIEKTHHVISGLPEKLAHNELWSAWRKAKSDHDLFVKVDADTVLRGVDTISTICKLFEANPRVTGLQAPLYDYMTDGLINGLNCFSPVVVFNDTRDELYCDRVDTGHDVVLRQPNLPPELMPAGNHCCFASERQAFHYGIHRTLKNQRATLSAVKQAWNRSQDHIRGFALLGQKVAQEFASNNRFNYSDVEFKDAFARAQTDYDRLIVEVNHG